MFSLNEISTKLNQFSLKLNEFSMKKFLETNTGKAIYVGVVTVTLSAVGPGSVDSLSPSGTVINFFSNDPRYSCLNGKQLAVYQYGLLTGKKVAVATTPTDCVTQEFTFPA